MFFDMDFKNSFFCLFLISFSASSIASQDAQDLCVLVSYGRGDNPVNAKNSYKYLYPSALSFEEKRSNQAIFDRVYSVVFSKDSLISSMFRENSYVQDLHRVMMQKIQNNPCVMIGHSRGAEMLLHYVALHNPKNLRALVLVGTPVSIGQAVKGKLFSFCNPKINASSMLESLKKIKNKSLPIILFHQKADALVSIENSQIIYNELRRLGFKNVEFVKMTSGGHNNLYDDDAYVALQSFYYQYNLPHDVGPDDVCPYDSSCNVEFGSWGTPR